MPRIYPPLPKPEMPYQLREPRVVRPVSFWEKWVKEPIVEEVIRWFRIIKMLID